MKVIILKQKVCPQCDALTMFLHAATKNKYAANIHEIMKEEKPEDFEEWVDKTKVMQTPSLIFVDESLVVHKIIQGFRPSEVKGALEEFFPNV